MEMDVNIPLNSRQMELKTISAGSYGNSNQLPEQQQQQQHQQRPQQLQQQQMYNHSLEETATTDESIPYNSTGFFSLLRRLLCSSNCKRYSKTSSSTTAPPPSASANLALHSDFNSFNGTGIYAAHNNAVNTAASTPLSYKNLFLKKSGNGKRSPQEIYFESRGKSCKKLLKFNGRSNKILLYPEEGWARTASSSYWTITPCWWQPNRCRIEEFAGTQRHVTTKAKMVSLEQKGSLLIAGHFNAKHSSSTAAWNATRRQQLQTSSLNNNMSAAAAAGASPLAAMVKKKAAMDEFKLYLSSNISMEDYNMGYCLTGFVERRCQQTQTFQMTHFAVIKRQWPSLVHTKTKSKTTNSSSSASSSSSSSSASSSAAASSTSAKTKKSNKTNTNGNMIGSCIGNSGRIGGISRNLILSCSGGGGGDGGGGCGDNANSNNNVNNSQNSTSNSRQSSNNNDDRRTIRGLELAVDAAAVPSPQHGLAT